MTTENSTATRNDLKAHIAKNTVKRVVATPEQIKRNY